MLYYRADSKVDCPTCMWGRLTIIDMGRELRVAPIDDPDDWVVCFAKESGFPAQEWADRMIALYNAAPAHRQNCLRQGKRFP